MSKKKKPILANAFVEALAEALAPAANAAPPAPPPGPTAAAVYLALKQRYGFLVNPQAPQADWELAGAFAEASLLLDLHEFFITGHGLKLFYRVQGAPPCLWAGGLAPAAGGLKSQEEILRTILAYDQWAIGVTADFSNPGITESQLEDVVGNFLLEQLCQHNRTGLNGVLTDSPLLARHVRQHYPALKLAWLAAPAAGRLPERQEHYRNLAHAYDRIQIHADDAGDRELLAGLGDPGRYSLPVDDSCDRRCPFREEHRRLVAAINQQPLDAALKIRESQILQRQGCLHPPATPEASAQSLVLNNEDWRWLYEQGFRHWLVQGGRRHSQNGLAMTLFRLLFNHDPSLSHVVARIWQKFFLWHAGRSS